VQPLALVVKRDSRARVIEPEGQFNQFSKGAPNIGGPSVSAAGLTFIAATPDMYLRAFDSETGEELWKAKLPTGGHATPTIYRASKDQKQYVVIAAGGHFGMPHEPAGDWLVAFALPD